MTTIDFTAVIENAQAAAYKAALLHEKANFSNGKWGACGFAWVNLVEFEGKQIKGNTKAGKMLKSAGVRQNHERVFYIWNPSRYPTQNVDSLLAGAEAAAKVLRDNGFTAFADSRLD